MQGESRTTRTLLRMLGEEKRTELDDFVLESACRYYTNIKTKEQLTPLFENSVIQFLEKLNENDLMALRSYTGIKFKEANAILRGNWTWEEHGRLTENKEYETREFARELERLIDKFPSPNIDFTTYRGVELSSFKKHGVNSLEELESMKGKYMFEEGFTSTSIISETSYFGKTLDNGKTYNVGIQYLIPSESSDGALLTGDNLSFSPDQNEYIINKGSLVKIIDIQINKETNQAQLIATLIPKKIWNLEDKKEEEISQTK